MSAVIYYDDAKINNFFIYNKEFSIFLKVKRIYGQ